MATEKPITLNSSGKKVEKSLNLVTLSPGSAESGNINVTGTITGGGKVKGSQIGGNSSTPSISAGNGAGTSPTISITGSDTAGIIEITTGTNPAANATVVTIDFVNDYTTAPSVVLYPANNNAATAVALTGNFVETTTADFKIRRSTGNALVASTAYKWHYQVMEK